MTDPSPDGGPGPRTFVEASDVGRGWVRSRMPAARYADFRSVDVSGVNASLGGLAAAQAMFGVAAATAAGTGPSSGAPSGVAGGSLAGSGIDVAVLKMALDTERYMVNILA